MGGRERGRKRGRDEGMLVVGGRGGQVGVKRNRLRVRKTLEWRRAG